MTIEPTVQTTLNGRITHVEYQNDSTDFCVLDMLCDNDAPVRMCGNLSNPSPDDRLSVTGHYTAHPSIGRVFNFTHYHLKHTIDTNALRDQLSERTGLAKQQCEDLIACFGDDVYRMIETSPERLTAVRTINRQDADLAHNRLNASQYEDRLTRELMHCGLNASVIVELERAMGKSNDQRADPLHNPFLFTQYLNDVPIERSMALAKALSVSLPLEQQTAQLIDALRKRAKQGHTHTNRHELDDLDSTDLPLQHAIDLAIKRDLIRSNEKGQVALRSIRSADIGWQRELTRLLRASRTLDTTIRSKALTPFLAKRFQTSTMQGIILKLLAHKTILAHCVHQDAAQQLALQLSRIYEYLGAEVTVLYRHTPRHDDNTYRNVRDWVASTDMDRPEPKRCDQLIVLDAHCFDAHEMFAALVALPAHAGLTLIGDRRAPPPFGVGQPWLDTYAKAPIVRIDVPEADHPLRDIEAKLDDKTTPVLPTALNRKAPLNIVPASDEDLLRQTTSLVSVIVALIVNKALMSRQVKLFAPADWITNDTNNALSQLLNNEADQECLGRFRVNDTVCFTRPYDDSNGTHLAALERLTVASIHQDRVTLERINKQRVVINVNDLRYARIDHLAPPQAEQGNRFDVAIVIVPERSALPWKVRHLLSCMRQAKQVFIVGSLSAVHTAFITADQPRLTDNALLEEAA